MGVRHSCNATQLESAQLAGSGKAWRGFLFRFLVTTAAGLGSIAALNYVVNPQGIYNTHLVPPVLWNARSLKSQLLMSMQPPPEALILGSSRVMNMAPEELERVTGLRTFNAGVDLALAEDYYAMLHYAVETAHVRPKLVVISCDVESFHNQIPPNAFLTQPSVLSSFLPGNSPARLRWKSFTGLFSFDQTRASVIALARMARPHRYEFWHVGPNGQAHYTDWEQKRAAGKMGLPQEVRHFIEHNAERYDSYTALSQERLDYFSSTLEYARQHHIQAVVYLSPVHPALEEALRSHGYVQRKQELVRALREICARENVLFYDFSSPASFGGDPEHFYDGRHYDETLAPLVFPKVVAMRSDAFQ